VTTTIWRLLLAALLFGFAVFAARRLEHGDWSDPRTGQRHCRTAPDAVRAWTYANREPRETDRVELDRWIRENPDELDRLYGASCTTALHLAARFGREDLVRLLVDRGARLGARDEDGATALHLAARHGEAEVARVLLTAGADPGATTKLGRTPLHDAAQGFGTSDGLDARLEVARLLLARGADPNAREKSGFRPLRYVLSPGGDPRRPQLTASGREMAELFLEAGAAVGAIDGQGTTPLHLAAWLGDTALMRVLIARGAEIDAVDRFGAPLASAASGGHAAAAELLLANGARVERRSPGSPLPWEGLPLAQALTPAGEESRDLADRRRAIAALLLEHGGSAEERDGSGRTLLHWAAQNGDSARADFLLAHGADPDVADPEGFTALHRAAEEGHLGVVRVLLAHGADREARTQDGLRALDLAAGDPEMEAVLGPDVPR
jgi:ankyrin repeat protein